MTVAENLLLGREPGRIGFSQRRIRAAAEELVRRSGVELGVSVDAVVDGLSPATHQRIEIVKALADRARVLVMDEPTARLSEAERVALFDLMRRLAADGVGIIFISHYLDEVRNITDSVSVMRNGRLVATEPSVSLPASRMAELMLGEQFSASMQREQKQVEADDAHPVVLEGIGLADGQRLSDIDVTLRAGEILGIAGLVGSGRTRLARILAGADRPISGELRLRARPIRFANPRRAIAAGVVLIPEDRKFQALSMVAPIADNASLIALQGKLGRAGFVRRSSVRSLATRLIRDLRIVPGDPDALVGTLSGGNQQKVVLGKALASDPEVLVVDQPTAGVDIGTKAQIHHILRERARSGAAVLVISDDLDELYALSDRFLALRAGREVWSGRADEISYPELVELTATGQIGSRQ
jgi:ABC-type sugar transport system ATPase subunit